MEGVHGTETRSNARAKKTQSNRENGRRKNPANGKAREWEKKQKAKIERKWEKKEPSKGKEKEWEKKKKE